MCFLKYFAFKAKAAVCAHPRNCVFDFGPDLNHSVNYCPDCLTVVGYWCYKSEAAVFKVGDKFEMEKTRI